MLKELGMFMHTSPGINITRGLTGNIDNIQAWIYNFFKRGFEEGKKGGEVA